MCIGLKKLLFGAATILFKLSEAMVFPLIVFSKRQTEKRFESREMVKRFSSSGTTDLLPLSASLNASANSILQIMFSEE